MTQMVLPEGYTYSNFTYDDEGEANGYQTSNGVCSSGGTYYTCSGAVTQNIGYNVRGEIISQNNGSSSWSALSADGFICTKDSAGTGCTQSWDARNGAVVDITDKDQNGVANTFQYGYNTAGEQISIANSGTLSRTFDGDQHLVSQANNSSASLLCDVSTCYNYASPGDGVSYTWGTEGHPVEAIDTFAGNPSYSLTYWEHWNPATNDVLFETGPGGTNTDLALGTLGVSNATNGVEVEDRDPFGNVSATHDAYGFSSFGGYGLKTYYNTFGAPLAGASGLYDSGSDPQSAKRLYFAHGRPDEYDDAGPAAYNIAFQGVRAVDENTGMWMSPDQFGGYGDDPMSQMPYLWNNNNGLMYQDPSGFDPIPTIADITAYVPRLPPINAVSYDRWDTPGPDVLEGRVDFLAQAVTLAALSKRYIRTKQMRNCNNRGGTFIGLDNGNGLTSFECSADNPITFGITSLLSTQCNAVIKTEYSIPFLTFGVGVYPLPYLPEKVLPQTYASTYGAILNEQTCLTKNYGRGR